jgi:polyhydroxybutyrate depolymerase
MNKPSCIGFNARSLITVIVLLVTVLVGLSIYYLYSPSAKILLEPAEHNRIKFGGRDRSYSVYYPNTMKPNAGVLFALHPSMSSGGEMRSWVGPILERFAEQENLVVVYPDGYEGHFNDCRKQASYSARTENIDDVGFIKQIVNELSIQQPKFRQPATEQKDLGDKINPNKIYALGYSNGGHLAFRLALEAPDLVKGIIVIAANFPADGSIECQTDKLYTRVVGLIEGTEDPINPYKGGQVTLFGFGNRGHVLSAKDSAVWFSQALQIRSSVEQETVRVLNNQVKRERWKSDDAEVLLITIDGAGHTIPQSNFRFRRVLGATLEDDSVLESALQLFKQDI